ncbi:MULTISPECIES: HAD family phosphatase [unclassified Thioalkalivibrio]|uniref:histidinol-phosphatase n=1 Tax=unclassified Thioalkalivibrio TaxID=2621013 RepID=UPI000363B56E|nr:MULTISPECIES: HAD family hydrolase [unclassified Thioalkalivibrio]
MALALFDLDNTLLAGDSDHAWNQFLAEVGAVHPTCHAETNDRFYQEYVAGVLDIHEFCRFAFSPLAEHPRAQLDEWRKRFIDTLIRPMIAPGAPRLLAEHREAGDELVIITATNQFVTQPIADMLGVDHLIATLAEEREDGEFTGELTGVPCFQEGKIVRLRQHLADHPDPEGTIAQASFYSDSRNDIPLLEQVGRPVAVDPDPTLAEHARNKGWPVISLRDTTA